MKPEHVALLKKIIVLDDTRGATLRGKTGLGSQDGRAVGWLVGTIERDGNRWIYATLLLGKQGAPLDDELERIRPLRRELAEELLRLHGALPAR